VTDVGFAVRLTEVSVAALTSISTGLLLKLWAPAMFLIARTSTRAEYAPAVRYL